MSFLKLSVVDTQSGEVTTVALADVAADMSRYEPLGPVSDSGVITGAPEGGGSR
jgi:hypothetical protein